MVVVLVTNNVRETDSFDRKPIDEQHMNDTDANFYGSYDGSCAGQ